MLVTMIWLTHILYAMPKYHISPHKYLCSGLWKQSVYMRLVRSPALAVCHPHLSGLCLASSLTQSFTLIPISCWSQFPQSWTLQSFPALLRWSHLKARVSFPRSLSFVPHFWLLFKSPIRRGTSLTWEYTAPLGMVKKGEIRRYQLKSAFQYL